MIRSIAELPFGPRPALELLGFDASREALDLDYAAFGYCRVPEVDLWSEAGLSRTVPQPLLLALHGADEQPPGLDSDVLLEFDLGVGSSRECEVARDERLPTQQDASAPIVTVLLSRFLEVHLPPLLGPERDVVLVMCNPAAARPSWPQALGHRVLHYADGPVDTWLSEHGDASMRIRLHACRWHTLGAKLR